ncbi:MAG: hypothetical protein JWO65_2507 [Sphingomonas bacterium]|jgi:hypothetical protein|nr:hypothetical protein [Sphingomonas bacterium]
MAVVVAVLMISEAAHWCAVCGGSPDRKIVDQVEGKPRCELCAAADRQLGDFKPARPDGNAMSRVANPAAWDEWVRISTREDIPDGLC